MRALIVMLVSSAALADGGFDGSWRTNTASYKEEATSTYALKDGKFTCTTCAPNYTIPADGKPHPIVGSPYSDSASARVVSDDAIHVERFKAGKTIATIDLAVSNEGKTLTVDWTSVAPNGQAANGRVLSQRVGEVPASGNKVAGDWKSDKLVSASDSAIQFTIKTTDGGLELSDPTGDSYSAKFDGKKYAYKGDPGITHVVLKKIDDKTFEETDLRKGKIVTVSRYTLGADGKTLQVSYDDRLHHAKGSYTADRQ